MPALFEFDLCDRKLEQKNWNGNIIFTFISLGVNTPQKNVKVETTLKIAEGLKG